MGGAGLAGQVMEEVDELVTSIHPLTLGDGVLLFPRRGEDVVEPAFDEFLAKRSGSVDVRPRGTMMGLES